MDFVQELVLAVELSEVLGVAIAVGEDELIVIPNFAEMTVKVLKSLLKDLGCDRYHKLLKQDLVTVLEKAWAYSSHPDSRWSMADIWIKRLSTKEVGKSKTTKAKSARKRKQ